MNVAGSSLHSVQLVLLLLLLFVAGFAALAQYGRYLVLSRELLEVERKTALELRSEGRIDSEIARELSRSLTSATLACVPRSSIVVYEMDECAFPN